MKSIRRSNRAATIAQTQRFEAAAEEDFGDAFSALDDDRYKHQGEKCEIHLYERRFNTRGEPVILQSGSRSDLVWAVESSIEAALVVTRFYNHRKELESTQLEIKSPYIREAMKTVIGSYPGVNINSGGPILVPGDPMCLFHYRNELHSYASKCQNKKAREHILFCLKYLSKVLNREIMSYEELMQNEDAAPGLECPNLWMAFKPGTLLYARKEHGIDVISRLRSMAKVKSPLQHEYWTLVTEIITCDGSDFRFVSEVVRILNYDGYRPLTQLGIYPLEYHRDAEGVRTNLVARGKTYVSMLGAHHCSYDGAAWLDDWHGNGQQCSNVKGRIMIDSKEYNDDIRKSKLDFISDSRTIRSDFNEHQHMSDEELLMCDFKMPGFTLATKMWGMFNITQLKPVDYDEDAFAGLVLPPDIKKTLSSLIKLQEGGSSEFDDMIAGKGKGLIILLHGPPGVGKTFTAESIAEFSKRPLYTLGKHDFTSLGRGPAVLSSDRCLTAALARASKWKSIVLLDEADVFMQERSPSEMFRNEQVSVLLRILEYFDGTMILTTNRVQTIDAAFKSRIHLSLTYLTLPIKARAKIWETFILKATSQRRPRWLDAKFLKEISSEEINGREIKNIVRVSHALALNNKRRMSQKDILQGLKYLKDFERDFNKARNKKIRTITRESDSAKLIKLDNRAGYQDEQDQAENEQTKLRAMHEEGDDNKGKDKDEV